MSSPYPAGDGKINGGRHHCRPVPSVVLSLNVFGFPAEFPAVAKLLPAWAPWPHLPSVPSNFLSIICNFNLFFVTLHCRLYPNVHRGICNTQLWPVVVGVTMDNGAFCCVGSFHSLSIEPPWSDPLRVSPRCVPAE